MPAPLTTTFLGAGAIAAAIGNGAAATICVVIALIWQGVVFLSTGSNVDA